MILDIIIIGIILLCVILGYKKGLIEVAFKLISFIIAIVLSLLLYRSSIRLHNRKHTIRWKHKISNSKKHKSGRNTSTSIRTRKKWRKQRDYARHNKQLHSKNNIRSSRHGKRHHSRNSCNKSVNNSNKNNNTNTTIHPNKNSANMHKIHNKLNIKTTNNK